MDLPPLQLEMVRFGLQGQPAHELCRPNEPSVSLSTAISGTAPCRREASRIRIDEPPGWPVLPPPPLTREVLNAPPLSTTSSTTPFVPPSASGTRSIRIPSGAADPGAP